VTAAVDTTHLKALNLRLSHARSRLNAARTDAERQLRTVWVDQLEREVAGERQFLGLPQETLVDDLSDDDLLAELSPGPLAA
jgi:hypothetical protein